MPPENQRRAGQSADATRRPGIVPYIASWTAERRPLDPVVASMRHGGIAYVDEVPHDRDSHGVLWRRSTLRPGKGRPRYGAVHSARQRRSMRKLLCQICAEPADRTTEGFLWLLGDDRDDWKGWPENMAATHPPVCLPCSAIAVLLCPYLARGYVAVRVRAPQVGGVYGALYCPNPSGPPQPVSDVTVPYDDRQMPWVLAAQLVTALHDCTFIDLDAELLAAGLARSTHAVRSVRPPLPAA